MKPKVGRNFTSERGGGGVKGEVKNISLHWLQGIFETVPKTVIPIERRSSPQSRRSLYIRGQTLYRACNSLADTLGGLAVLKLLSLY